MKKDKMIMLSIVGIAVVLLAVGIILSMNGNKSYKVTFMSDGQVFYEETVKEKELIDRPTTPTKKNNRFIGWMLEGQMLDLNTYQVTKDITLVALFEEEEIDTTQEFLVVFLTGDLNYSVTTQAVKYNNLATEPDLSDVTWAQVTGWYFEDGTKFDFSTPITENLQLVVHYTEDGVEYVGYYKSPDIEAALNEELTKEEENLPE